MKILIITDIHYGEDTNYPQYMGEDYVNSFGSQFEKFLPNLKNLIAEHDLVINLGDLIHEVDMESDLKQYKKAMELLEMGKPVKHVLGNHDFRCLSKEQLSELIGTKKPYYSFDFKNYHHIVLDSFRNSRQEPCRIDEEQKLWLEKDLSAINLPTIVYCHYLLDNQSIESNYIFKNKPDRVFIENKENIRKILEASGKVLAVFSGHLHFFHEEIINNIKYITVPAFTENDGNNKPKAECLSVILEDNKVTTNVKNLGI